MTVVPNHETRAYSWQVVVVLTLVALLLWNTGLATDDYVHLAFALSHKVSEYLIPSDYLSVPLLHYTHGLAFFAIGDHLWAYDLLKAFYGGLSVYFATRFFGLFFPPLRALAIGFLFILFPIHDGASFWLTGQYLILSFACYLFAYVQGAAGRYSAAAFWASLASFSSYGSPPIAIGLSLLAVLKRRWQHAASLMVPNLVFVVYYLVTSAMLKSGTQRLTGEFSIKVLAKQFALQIATFIDSAIGPSAWAKVAYSLTALHGLALLVSLALAAALARWLSTELAGKADRHLVFASLLILLLAFGMFALTGLYPQLAFNLGDRVMVYGGFFLAVVLASLPLPRSVITLAVVVLTLAIGGVAAHWRDWNETTQQLATNIRSNQALAKLPKDAALYVAGYQYSRLGPYCHIEFLTADYVAKVFFDLQLKEKTPERVLSFNRRLAYSDGKLLDRKYGTSQPVTGSIWLYDTEANRLDQVPVAAIQSRIDALPDETRHWTQRLGEGWLRNRLLELVPRLRFAY
jgi:hypothetical protein